VSSNSNIIKTNDPNLVQLSQELIKAGIIATVVPDTCWLDGSRCPFGYPEGTFEKRPTTACFVGDKPGYGCHKLTEHKTELLEFSRILINKEAEPKLIEVFNRFGVTLSSEIAMLADDNNDEGYATSSLEKTILINAASIIEREEKNVNIAPIDNKVIRRKDFEK